MDLKETFINWIKEIDEDTIGLDAEQPIVYYNLLEGLKFLFDYCSCIEFIQEDIDDPDIDDPDFRLVGIDAGFFDGMNLLFFKFPYPTKDGERWEVTDEPFDIENKIEDIINSLWDRIPPLELEKFIFTNIIN